MSLESVLAIEPEGFLSPPPEPSRHRLPDTRRTVTRRVKISHYRWDQDGKPIGLASIVLFLRVGLYHDGSPGEVFVDVAKQGDRVAILIDAWSTLVSMLLQYGVPLEAICRKFVGVGDGQVYYTDDPDLPRCTSPEDFICRWLTRRFGASGEPEELARPSL